MIKAWLEAGNEDCALLHVFYLPCHLTNSVVTVELSSPEYNATEDDGYVNVTVIKNGVSAAAIAVLFSTRDQTATGNALMSINIEFMM